ncbi:PAS domain S-box protein [Pseudanabaenaceae cyanobacterium LEGE 13415]|nr:PAS domain S-box protein [Pseudanabaenaceae cyanobacterium LEGE 13415]
MRSITAVQPALGVPRLVRLDLTIFYHYIFGQIISERFLSWNNSLPLALLLIGLLIVLRLNKTQQWQLKEQLQLSDQQFKATFNQAAVGIAHVAPDGSWRQVNQKLCEIVGYTKAELLQRNFQEITDPDDLNADLTYVQKLLAGEIQTYTLEKRYLRKDRSIVWISVTVSLVRTSDGKPDYFIAVIEDIHDRKLAQLNEQFLSSLDRQLRQLSDPDIMAAKAVQQIGEFLKVDRCVWGRVEGNQDIVVLEQDWRPRTDISSIEGAYPLTNFMQPNLLKLMQNGQPAIISDVVTDTYTAAFAQRYEPYNVRAFVVVPYIAEGKWVALLTVHQTTTRQWRSNEVKLLEEIVARLWGLIEQTRITQALRRLNQTLEQQVAERTAQLQETNQELEAFTYSVSHDLRAPLRIMQGFSQALQEDYAPELDDIAQSYIESIVESAVQMDELINDLLSYSRLSRAQIDLLPTNLNHVVEVALQQLQAQIQEQTAIVKVAPDLPTVLTHRPTLVQVVTNLISNAIKFVDRAVQPQVSISAEVDQNQVRLWVSDNGIGIAPEHQSRIFRVFERLHGVDTYPGTGIGLAIVQKGIERMGGQFGVESQLGVGSRFWIALPQSLFH